ncbi:hypothetical protein [Streptomyces iranensis]|uniref:hypothetical protein n=1 Tax=Streptomyces iranensis TaxID=576784 RepID=UPI0039B76186
MSWLKSAMRAAKKGEGHVAFVALFTLAPLLAFISLLIYTFSTASRGASAFASGVFISMASAATGSLFGFLFGIPRSRQRGEKEGFEKEEDREETSGNFGPNTNLEQISDWLTKILVGVGLVQIGNGTDAARRLVKSAGEAMGGTASARPVSASIIVTFVAWGFMVSYILTYTRGPRAFHSAYVMAVKKFKNQSELDAHTIEAAARVLDPPHGGRVVQQEEINSWAIQATSETRIWIFRVSKQQLDDALRDPTNNGDSISRTTPIFRALTAADAEYPPYVGYLGIALAMQSDPHFWDAEASLSEAIRLRRKREDAGWLEYEFYRVLCRIELKRNVDAIIQDLVSIQ